MKLHRWWPVLSGVLGVLALTAPFLWWKLDYRYALGTVTLSPHVQHGLEFFFNLLPVLGVALILVGLSWAYRHWLVPYLPTIPAYETWPAWMRSIQGISAGYLALIMGLAFLPPTLLQNALFVCFYMLLALGLNVAIGFTGILVLGYAGFYALGGYVFAIGQMHLPWLSWWMALPLGFIVGGLTGWLTGLPCLRLRGDYLAIVTLGFGESFREMARNLPHLTNGDKGITLSFQAKIQPIFGLSALQSAFLSAALIVGLTTLALHRLYRSRVGRAWIAIREDEIAASSMGISVVKLKLLAFSLSAAIASMAGVLRVGYTGFINPAVADFQESVIVLAMVILGGLGSIPGVLLGAALLYLLPSWLRNQDLFTNLPDYRLLIFGVILVVTMLLRPQGLLGSRRHQHELMRS